MRINIPEQRDGAQGNLVMGVRPEHVRLDAAAPYRGQVIATEYLGTTQIVTIRAGHGDVKARVPSSEIAVPGETVGLRFDPRTITVFDQADGKALVSSSNERVLGHG